VFDDVGFCLDELEQEYLSCGIAICEGFEDHTQLSAFLMLGIRSIGLLRGMMHLAHPEFLDSYDVVRRAFIESWQLQLELKLCRSSAKAQKWLEAQPNAWKVDRELIEELVVRLHGERAGFAREWGELSEMCHPTFQAVVNSIAIASTIAGLNPRPYLLKESLENLKLDFIGMVNREIWLTLQRCGEFIETPLNEIRIPLCLALHTRFIEPTK
jgi:hypothetical protein